MDDQAIHVHRYLRLDRVLFLLAGVMRSPLALCLGSRDLLFCGVEEGLEPGKSASTSSRVPSRPALWCSLLGSGRASVSKGSSMRISLSTLVCPRSKRKAGRVDVT